MTSAELAAIQQEVEERNAATSKREVEEFITNPPARYFAYVKLGDIRYMPFYQGRHDREYQTCEVTTWMGDRLARGSVGPAYRSNMGDTRRPIDCVGINGVEYYGTFYEGAGDYCRLYARKGQTTTA